MLCELLDRCQGGRDCEVLTSLSGGAVILKLHAATVTKSTEDGTYLKHFPPLVPCGYVESGRLRCTEY